MIHQKHSLFIHYAQCPAHPVKKKSVSNHTPAAKSLAKAVGVAAPLPALPLLPALLLLDLLLLLLLRHVAA